jgi:hypothetical protein
MRSLLPRRRSWRALALLHRDAGLLEEADEARAVTARALDREGGDAELL